MYKTPKSELEVNNLEHQYLELKMQQRPVLGFTTAILLSIVTLALLSLESGRVPGIIFFLPGVAAGLGLKLIGRPISEIHRVIPSIFVGLLVFLYFLGNGLLLTYIMPLLNLGCCYAISRRTLNYEQECILYKKKLNKI